MIRVLLFSLAALTIGAALFLPRPAVAALTLTNTDAGYSITLPEGWKRMSPAIAREKSEAFGHILPLPEDSSVRMHVQGAVLRQPGFDLAQELLILSVPNKAFGLDADALNLLAEPGNPILENLASGLYIALDRSGMSVRSGAMFADGLRLSYGHDALYGVMEFRFSIGHAIIAILTAENTTDASFLSTLPGTLAIAPDKQLGRKELRKFKESMSSLFAIAAMLVMIWVMRRQRRQVLGR